VSRCVFSKVRSGGGGERDVRARPRPARLEGRGNALAQKIFAFVSAHFSPYDSTKQKAYGTRCV